MGYQHGALMREHCQKNADTLLNDKIKQLTKLGPIALDPRLAIRQITAQQRKFVPAKYFSEMDGVADGSGVSRDDVQIINFLPELFHCSGFAVMDTATTDGTLYHGRVLDYAVDWQLQDHAVLIVAEPAGGIPFVNVSYAGFIGSVSGMNARHVSIGEMGGDGLGHWQGVPMSLLVREVLETAANLEAAINVFRQQPRTCEYFYVIADGKTNRAVGVEANWQDVRLIQPGESHPRLTRPIPDAVLLSAGDRYQELVRRVKASYGVINAQSALRLMDPGVAMKSNLHNVLFESRSTKFWVANASPNGEPAAKQKYHAFQLSELLQRHPDATAVRIAWRQQAATTMIPAKTP